jgi:hypothetical protein
MIIRQIVRSNKASPDFFAIGRAPRSVGDAPPSLPFGLLTRQKIQRYLRCGMLEHTLAGSWKDLHIPFE